MMLKSTILLFFFAFALNFKAKLNDNNDLFIDIKNTMYSNPNQALKTAQYIIDQNPGNFQDVYYAYLSQVEILINFRRFDDAVKKMIYASRYLSKINNQFYLARAQYLLSKIYIQIGFNDMLPDSIKKLESTSKSLTKKDRDTVLLWITELKIDQLFIKQKYAECAILFKNNNCAADILKETFQNNLGIIALEIKNASTKVDFDNNSYVKFLSKIMMLQEKLKNNTFSNEDFDSLKKNNPQYSDVFFIDIYKSWSEQECRGLNFYKCHEIRKIYINTLKSSMQDVQKARINVIQLSDQIEAQEYSYKKKIQSNVLIILTVGSLLFIFGYLIYRLILKYQRVQLEKNNILEDYNSIINIKSEETKRYNISEKTEQSILLSLEKFENSNEFTNPKLSLVLLAKKIDTNPKYLSEIIKTHRKKNFNLYINELKIKYIVDCLIKNPEYLLYKTSYLAEEAGFTSRTTFTTIFKNIMGVSPSQFISQLKNDKNLL